MFVNSKQRRRERRNNNVDVKKLERRLYTYDECLEIMSSIIKKTENECIARYSICMAVALASPPLNFGKKRVCNALQLFFDQMEGIKLKLIEVDDIEEEAKLLGVNIDRTNDIYSINIDSRSKKAKLTEKIKEIKL